MWYPLLDWPFIGALCCLLLNVVFVWHVKQWKVWQISLHDISMENKAYLIQINEGFLQYGTSAYASSHCHCKYSYTKCFTKKLKTVLIRVTPMVKHLYCRHLSLVVVIISWNHQCDNKNWLRFFLKTLL